MYTYTYTYALYNKRRIGIAIVTHLSSPIKGFLSSNYIYVYVYVYVYVDVHVYVHVQTIKPH